MGEAAERQVTYAEYLAFEEAAETKHEFVDGVIVAMAGGSLEHARLASFVTARLQLAAEKEGCRVLSSDGRVRIGAVNQARYADAVVVCGEVERAPDDREGLANPTLIVEVLSPSTERVDRGEKLAAYKRLDSLREYLLVAQDPPRIEVYRRVSEGWLHLDAGPGEALSLTSVDVTLDVDLLYRDRIPPAE